MKREFVQLAHEFDPAKHRLGGWWWSEKLDGQRCIWDGGCSRGLLKKEVPYANLLKDDRYKEQQITTGLFSRYGNVIHAPDWWLDQLPPIPLDGELYIDRDTPRQTLRSIISTLTPGPIWRTVKYHIFGSPPIRTIFEDGVINNTNCKMVLKDCDKWAIERGATGVTIMRRFCDIDLQQYENDVITVEEQHELPQNSDEAYEVAMAELARISALGGEGLIVRDPNAAYICGRTHMMLKMKKLQDAEGRILGYTAGRKTELGSKLLGLMGALIVDFDGIRLELSGFTDAERVLMGPADVARAYAAAHPGLVLPDWIYNPCFPRGTRITFKYRGKSKEGVPQEARYWRKWEVE